MNRSTETLIRLIKFIFIFSFIFIFFYGIGAFCNYELNPGKWIDISRTLIGIFGITISFFAAASIIKSEK